MKNKNLFRTRGSARLLITLIALITLGVGQMWAEYEYGKYNLYLDISSNTGWKVDNGYVGFHFSYNENSNGEYIGRYKATLVEGNIYCVSASTHNNAYIRGIKAARWAVSDDGNTNNNWNIASNTHPTNSSSHSSTNCIKIPSGGWTDCSVSWTAYIPTVSSVALSYNVVPSSGSGTSGDPYIVPTGTTVRVTATPTSVIDDSQMTMKYKWDSGSWGTTKYKDLNCSTNNTTYSTTVTCKNEFNSNKGNGADATVYFKAVSDPTITLNSVSPSSSIVAGNDITLVGERANSSNTISFQYSTNSGSTWTNITPKTSSLSSNTLTITWAVPDAHGATQTFLFRAKLAEATPIYSSASDGVTVYNTKTFKVKNTNNWATMKVHRYDDSSSRESWPGSTDGITSAGGQWKTVVLTSEWPYFILNDNNNGNQIKGSKTYSYASSVTDGNCYAISSGTGTNLTFSSATCPSAPTSVTTSEDAPTSVSNAKMTIHGNIGGNGNDNITDYGFYYGTTSSPGTKAQVGTSDKTGAISKQLTGLTAGTTYYYKTYATNGQGTSYGDVESYKLPYKVTVTQPTGCSAITNSGTNYTNSTIEVTATKATGYTFSSWSTTNGTVTSTSSTSTTNTIVFTPTSDNATIAPVYTENMTTVNLIANPTGKGTFTSGGAVTSVSAGVTTHPTVTAVAGTGYHLTGTIWSESSSYISISATNTASTTITATGTTGNEADLTATFTPNTYRVQFHRNGGAGDVVYQDFTYDVAQNLTANTYTKTGYNFAGWALTTSGEVTYADEASATNLTTTNEGTFHLYAKWSAKSYTVTLDVDEENHGTIAGATESQTVTYDGATTTVPNRPTAAQGYALDGYYTDQAGEGLKVINGDGTWIASVSGYTDGSKKWKHDDNVTLYAYYKKAEITNLVLSAIAVAPSTTGITATPTISPTPTGTTVVCYELQYSNGTALPDQSSLSVTDNVLTFTAPAASATYRIEAKLRLDDCDGTVLDTRYTTFQVAGEHTVTIKYQDSDGRTLRDTTHITARPLSYSDAITAPSIVGYTFHHWVLGDGITLKAGQAAGDKDTPGTATINIYASYAGTLTAVYTKKNVIYFNNTLGWKDVYVYFYNTNKYWSDTYGSGAMKDQGFGDGESEHPYWEQEHGHMTHIEGTDIWYFDYTAVGYSTRANVVFTEGSQHGNRWFYNTKAARRSDHKASLPMFVPLTTKTETKNGTDYYSSGYWMNYPENTGYRLLIYDQKAKDGAKKLFDIPFEFTADYTMPMELNVYLDASYTYGFEIKRADGTYYSNGTTYTANTTNQTISTSQTTYCGLTTTAAGDYTFRLYYSSSNYKMDVTYPVATNDWRIVYTDATRWSKAATSHYHPSGVITKNGSATAVKKDTVSFFWAYGSSPAIKYQKCTATGAGSVTWNSGTAIDVDDFSSVLTKKGVYNFIFEQPKSGGSISLVGVEPYTGNYYIRTDVAGSTKWSNYQSHDHQMTYSDYAEDNSGYSHYYCHWVKTGTNVKFCIANDYSPCISDTLAADYGTVVANITAEGYADAGRLNSADANIRFMWNQSTNKISRAYIGGSGDITKKFLVLEGNNKMYDENGNSLTGTHQDHDKYGNYLGTDHQVILHDDENFVYERTIKVNTTARARLSALYNTNTQYFIGSSGDWGDGTTVELLGGSASGKHKMRIVYDFKTNRLVKAYLPEGEISSAMAINADLMIIREHQEDGQQLTFTGSGALSDVHTVYGVMRFNKWTLNNKDKSTHSVLGDPKSAYERGLYWVSFPFNVNLSDVFGFGTYGVDWIMMEYDGAERAQKGYWKDSDGFWKYITDRSSKTLEAGKGYVLALDLARMKDNDDDFWTNNIEQVELFFPSADNVGGIAATDVTTTIASHECTIDRTGNNGSDINKNRKKADSHWNLIGVPSYANYGTTLTSDGSSTITWNTTPSATNSLPFLYEWNMVDNTYTVQSGTTYPFKAMHAYMVQYAGELHWSLASATPKSIVARRTYAEKPQNVEFRLELQQNDKMVDQTFVKLSDDENASANFIFDEDLCKEYNGTKANIYTFIEGYIPAAGNTLPMTEQTTVVPVGVKTVASGDYTFAMPAGTEGVGVTLIDSETGLRTNLGLTDYTVSLESGTYDERFALEISPIKQTPTDIELLNGENGENGVRKVMIDGILYIVKDGKVFDARGSRVK